MPNAARSRPKLALCGLLLVSIGLASRRPGLPEFVLDYAGDVLWGALFFVLCAGVWPRARVGRLWFGATLATELVEFGQLYRAPWIGALRGSRLGGLLLGHVFSWSDVVCVAFGTTLALASARPRARALTSPHAPRAAVRTPKNLDWGKRTRRASARRVAQTATPSARDRNLHGGCKRLHSKKGR